MTKSEEAEAALRESDRMRILASQYRQLGFSTLARWINQNADAALKFATEKESDTDGE